LFAKKIPTGSGLHYRFPETFGLSGRTIPKLPRKGFIASLKSGEAATGEVMLFVGCVFDHVFPRVGRASYESMKASGKSIAVFLRVDEGVGEVDSGFPGRRLLRAPGDGERGF
ncbi:MAG: 4Fe-4S ferredoxin-type protein, partial [Actinobacteria bacterium]|nr:4Fe-4S ferredoxin-type protein [Actinomycetota bacterium]